MSMMKESDDCQNRASDFAQTYEVDLAFIKCGLVVEAGHGHDLQASQLCADTGQKAGVLTR